jgi:hypothetical protein
MARQRRWWGSAIAVAAVALLAGCGGGSGTSSAGPTASLYVIAPASSGVTTGVKLALSDRGGRAGVFRVGLAIKLVAADGPRARPDAAAAARQAIEDPSTSAVVSAATGMAARDTITLLNESGIPTVLTGSTSGLTAEVCSARSAIYPNGLRSAVIAPAATIPADFRTRFHALTGADPGPAARQGYAATLVALDGLALKQSVKGGKPPKVNREALTTELTTRVDACGG